MKVQRAINYVGISSLDDIKENLSRYIGNPIFMSVSTDIVVDNVVIPTWSKIYCFYSNGSTGDQVLLAVYPNPNRLVAFLGLINGEWVVKQL